MMRHIAAGMVALALAGHGVAQADDDCHVSMDRWQPREAVETMAAARNWTVTRIRVDDGCYEIRGTDETGRAFKAKIDPATLDIVRFRHRDRDDDRRGSGHALTHG
ncbi:PepSY domain-containing protein [Shinella sp.]|uniref:PepSY domain-containing protein n=1 Tax=Shinella sp. TaxID=1870904 RepID=UPI00301D6FB1